MDYTFRHAQVRDAVLALPDLASWPEVATLFPETPSEEGVRLDWLLPAVGCRAVGAGEEVALPAVAAVACLQISIILVDDILDADPRGAHNRMGAGRAANLALGLQAAAFALLDQAPAPVAARNAAAASLAKAALGTARGQEMDVQNLKGEAAYWELVRAKSTPFYAAAPQIGALLAGANATVAQGIYDVGATFGELVQIFDDLEDGFATPANPDWTEGRNNLAILYALTADHPQRARLAELMPRTADPAVLAEAQHILVTSGAASYCVYQLIQRYRGARARLAGLQLAEPGALLDLLEHEISPLYEWLPAVTGIRRDELEKAMG